MRLRLAFAALAVLLAGCEPSFNADLVATPLADKSAAVTLRLDGIELRKSDGGFEKLKRSSTGVYLVDTDVDPVPEDLLSNSDIDGGNYDGVKLLLADDLGTVSRAGQAQETIEAGTAATTEAEVSFNVDKDKDETTSIVVALDLVLSLAENEDEAGFTFDPVIRAMKLDDAASVSGSIPASRFADTACRTGTLLVYAFKGKDVEPDERDGSAVEPFATTPITRTGTNGPGSYLLDYMPAGDYTLAFTCEGQFENGRLPAEDEDVDFFEGAEVELKKGESVRVDFDT